MGLHSDDASQQQDEISNLAKSLPPPTNTRIPLHLVKQHNSDWQAYLQRISDFLLEGEGVWWCTDGEDILFNDITNSPRITDHGLQLHHFRSSSLKEEDAYLQKCWEECIANDIQLPTEVIKVDDPDNHDTVKTVHQSLLQDDKAIHDHNPEPTLSVDEPNNLALPETSLDVQLSKDEIIPFADPEPFQIKDNSSKTDEAQQIIPNQVEMPEIPKSKLPETRIKPKPTETPQPKPTETLTLKSSSEQNSKNVDIYPLKTRLAKGVALVLENVEEVQKLDRKRCKLKDVLKSKYQIGKQEAIEDYECVLAPLKSKVLAEQSKAKSSLTAGRKLTTKRTKKLQLMK